MSNGAPTGLEEAQGLAQDTFFKKLKQQQPKETHYPFNSSLACALKNLAQLF